MSLFEEFYGIEPAKFALGARAFHAPLNLILYRADSDPNKIAGVCQSSMGAKFLHGSDATHVLLMGDLFYRPHLAMGTNQFIGAGVTGLLKDGFISPDKWDQIILPPI